MRCPPEPVKEPSYVIQEILTLVFSPDGGVKYAVIPIPPTPSHEVPRFARPPIWECPYEIDERSRRMLSGKEGYPPGYFDGIPEDPRDAEAVYQAWRLRRAEVKRIRDG